MSLFDTDGTMVPEEPQRHLSRTALGRSETAQFYALRSLAEDGRIHTDFQQTIASTGRPG